MNAKSNLEQPFPFGMLMPNRQYSATSTAGYRFGYQGSLKDNDLFGTGNSYSTQFRELDTRIGRWWSVDPDRAKTPWEAPYASMANSPILSNDILGNTPGGGNEGGGNNNRKDPKSANFAGCLIKDDKEAAGNSITSSTPSKTPVSPSTTSPTASNSPAWLPPLLSSTNSNGAGAANSNTPSNSSQTNSSNDSYGVGFSLNAGIGVGKTGREVSIGMLSSGSFGQIFFSFGKAKSNLYLNASASAQLIVGKSYSNNFDLSGRGQSFGLGYGPASGTASQGLNDQGKVTNKTIGLGPSYGIKVTGGFTETKTWTFQYMVPMDLLFLPH